MPQTARCKFTVLEVTQYGGTMRRVKLGTQYDKALSEEDRAFCKATPQGEMTVTIDNPNIFDVFKPGQAVYVDITPVE